MIMKQKQAKCRIKVFEKDGRMEISLHPHDFAIPEFIDSRPPVYKEPLGLMTKKCYVRNLKSNYNILFARDYPDNKYYCMVTLTLQDRLKALNKKHDFVYYVGRFIDKVKYRFPDIEYARAIEYTQDSNLHAHLILQFDEQPLLFTKKLIEKIWKLGICHKKKVTDIYGALEYITKFKRSNIAQTDRGQQSQYTKFPKGTKVISYSQGFGVPAKFKVVYLDKERVHKMLELYKDEFVRMEGHNYHDSSSISGIGHCLDKVYLKSKNIPNIDPLDQLAS